MKKILPALYLLLCGFGYFDAQAAEPTPDKPQNGVVYTFSGGRFGDNLIAYLHAKWISYKYQVPLLYTPFPYSDQLTMDKYESMRLADYQTRFENYVLFKNEVEMESPQSNTIYEIPYFPDNYLEVEMFHLEYLPYFVADWEDPGFSAELKKMVRPKNHLQLIKPPKGYLSVAMHMRRGGGVDSADMKLIYPLKLPPETYYVEAIKRIRELYPHEKIYIFIFTDDLNPSLVLKEMKKRCQKMHKITFDCRKEQNGPTLNVLEDFFSMLNFDCLIRTVSSYSTAVEKLGRFRVAIGPKHCHIEGPNVTIDELEVNVR